MACSEHGAISRLRPIAQASRCTVADSPRSAQNAVELDALPELMADVDRAGFTMALGGDARWIHLDQGSAGCSRR